MYKDFACVLVKRKEARLVKYPSLEINQLFVITNISII